jgi:hypothetical protein
MQPRCIDFGNKGIHWAATLACRPFKRVPEHRFEADRGLVSRDED